HRYIVRNTREFLESMLTNRFHYFTKKFTYDPSQHYFLQQDKEIFELLSTFLTTGDMFTDRGYFSSLAYDRRALLIPPIAFKQLLSLLIERNVIIQVKDYDFQGFELVEQSSPYHFTVTNDEEEKFVLRMEGIKDSIFLRDYKVIFDK